jgi:hypothetical protein
MKKYLFGVLALVVAISAVAFTTQPSAKGKFDTKYFRYAGTDINFNTLKASGNWDEISLPITECEAGTLPCVVSVENLQDYGGSYSPGVIDEVDFAHFLDLMGSSSAQSYVTGPNEEASKE